MKKIISFLLILTSAFCLVACSGNKYKEKPADEFYLKYACPMDSTKTNGAQHLLSRFYHNTEEYGEKVIISLIYNSDGDNGTGGSGKQYKYIKEFLEKRGDVNFYCIYMDSYLGEGEYYKDKINKKTNTAYGEASINNFFRDYLKDILEEAKDVYMNSPFGSHDYEYQKEGNWSFTWVTRWATRGAVMPFTFYVDNTSTKPSYAGKTFQLSEVYPFVFDSVETIENMVDHQGFFKE